MTEDERMGERERCFQDFLIYRDIETPCTVCSGFGVRGYGSTATWHGGCGGATCTSDICDHCWGSGDEFRHGVDLRALYHDRTHQTEEAALRLVEAQIPTGLSVCVKALDELERVMAREERRRKLPDGLRQWEYESTVRCFRSLFRRLRDAAERRNSR